MVVADISSALTWKRLFVEKIEIFLLPNFFNLLSLCLNCPTFLTEQLGNMSSYLAAPLYLFEKWLNSEMKQPYTREKDKGEKAPST